MAAAAELSEVDDDDDDDDIDAKSRRSFAPAQSRPSTALPSADGACFLRRPDRLDPPDRPDRGRRAFCVLRGRPAFCLLRRRLTFRLRAATCSARYACSSAFNIVCPSMVMKRGVRLRFARVRVVAAAAAAASAATAAVAPRRHSISLDMAAACFFLFAVANRFVANCCPSLCPRAFFCCALAARASRIR